MHGGGGPERHCIVPGRFRYSLYRDGSLAETRNLDWVGFMRGSDGINVESQDPTGALPDNSLVDNTVIYDGRTGLNFPPLTVQLQASFGPTPDGPWTDLDFSCPGGACPVFHSIPPGSWLRLGAWNTVPTYAPPPGGRNSRTLLMRVSWSYASDTSSFYYKRPKLVLGRSRAIRVYDIHPGSTGSAGSSGSAALLRGVEAAWCAWSGGSSEPTTVYGCRSGTKS